MRIIETKQNIKEFERNLWNEFWKDKKVTPNFGAFKYIIQKENTDIGYIHLTTSGGVMFVKDIIIKLEQRGKGVGHTIMDFIIKTAKEKECHKIRLETSSDFMPGALHIYKKYGFIEEIILKNDRYNMDWVIMSKVL